MTRIVRVKRIKINHNLRIASCYDGNSKSYTRLDGRTEHERIKCGLPKNKTSSARWRKALKKSERKRLIKTSNSERYHETLVFSVKRDSTKRLIIFFNTAVRFPCDVDPKPVNDEYMFV